MHKADSARSKYLGFIDEFLGPADNPNPVGVSCLMHSKPSDLILLVITQWFEKHELLAHKLSNLRGTVESSKKWLYNFVSEDADSSLVLQHDGFCHRLLHEVVRGEYEKKQL